MNIVLTLVEQWGMWFIAGMLVIYFSWHMLAFIQAQPVTFKHDPILTTTTLGWGSLWILGNGMGNALFIFTVVDMVISAVIHHTGTFDLPTLPGVEALVFLSGLMPSLYQFRYQADPAYIATLTLSRRAVAIGMTVADGLFCALGWYWWLLPPTLVNGQFDFIYDQNLVGGAILWSILSSYVAQYMAHMQLYDLLGLEPPTLTNPLAEAWAQLQRYLPWDEKSDEPTTPRKVSSTPRRPSQTTRSNRFMTHPAANPAQTLRETE
jgi:hypothetical protein